MSATQAVILIVLQLALWVWGWWLLPPTWTFARRFLIASLFSFSGLIGAQVHLHI